MAAATVPSPDSEVIVGDGGTHALWGRVAVATGRPLEGAEVFWIDPSRVEGGSVGFLDAFLVGRTDGEGQFFSPGFPGGEALLLADFQQSAVDGGRLFIEHAARVTLPPRAGGEGVVLRFPFTPAAYGTLVAHIEEEAGGKPVPRHRMILRDAERKDGYARAAATDRDGNLVFRFVPPGKYHLTVLGTPRYPTGVIPVEIPPGKPVQGRVQLQHREPGPRHSLLVRVEDACDEPVEGAHLRIDLEDAEVPDLYTDEDGVARTDDLPDPPLSVTAAVEGCWTGTAPVEAAGEGRWKARVVLAPAVLLRVLVRDAGTGLPLRRANVLVHHHEGEEWDIGNVLPDLAEEPFGVREYPVPLGEVRLEAAAPGFLPLTRTLSVPPGGPEGDVVMDLERTR